MKISLFPRNRLQINLFEGVGGYLRDAGFDIDLIYPKVSDGINKGFYPESDVSNMILANEIDFSKEFQRICKTYSNVNRIIQSDREMNYFPLYFGDKAVSREEKIKLCCAFFICFERYIERFKPELIVSEMVLGLMDGVLFEVAQSHGIVYLGVRPSKTKAGVIFCDNPYDRPVFFDKTIQSLKAASKKDLYGEALQIVRKNIKPNVLPHYMKRSGRTFRIFTFRALKSVFRVLFKSSKLPKVSICQH